MPTEQEIGLAERIGKFINNSPTTAMLIFMGILLVKSENRFQDLTDKLTKLTNEQLNDAKESKSEELRLKEKELDYKYKYPKNDTAQ